MAVTILKSALCLVSCLAAATAQTNLCRFYLADQYDFPNNLGIALDLETTSIAGSVCQLGALQLTLAARGRSAFGPLADARGPVAPASYRTATVRKRLRHRLLGVADGKTFRFTVSRPQWQMGHVYVATAVVTPTGSQLFLDGQMLGSLQGAFRPFQRALYASEVPSWANGSAAYRISQASLQISTGSSGTPVLSLPVGGASDLPPALILLTGGPAIWQADYSADPAQTTTITATFRIDPAVSDPHQFDPYIDRYGQSAYGDWPFKVQSDDDLQAAIVEEQAWLSDNAAFAGLDPFGGSTVAGWQDQATGYYHTTFQNNRWWLISPQGNPGFYISLSDVPQYRESTPITGRESMFAELPPQTGQFAAAWSHNWWGETGGDTIYVSFELANLVRKYGDGWQNTAIDLSVQRLGSWGFAGMGKWSAPVPGVPVMPVLNHAGVPNAVAQGHPDIFDPSVVTRLSARLASQIGSNIDNPYIVGWSIGNEYDEIITPDETKAMLALGATAPAKRALVDQALVGLYGGDIRALAASWKITAAAMADVYAASPNPPALDIEALRQFFAVNYYRTLYQTVKSIDPNHLYFGFWIVPGWWVNSHDWEMMAANCDVIGFDYYAPEFLSAEVDSLIRAANKPVMIGEYSFPSAYNGMRGFRSFQQVATSSDAESGDRYAKWLRDTSAYPYCVGVSWFEYRDEPVSGRGDTGGHNAGPNLVYGEDYAFGLVDVADRPKYDLVEKVRAANLSALQSLGLQ